MPTHGFDEMQVATRNRIASETLALTLLSVFAAAWLGDTWHIWATGLQQALAIFWIAFGYFNARAIWSHALYRLEILDI